MKYTLSDFIKYAKARIGQSYMIIYADDRATATRTLKKVMADGRLVSVDDCYGSVLTAARAGWDGEILNIYTLKFKDYEFDDNGRQIPQVDERGEFCYSLQFNN